jgi:hypothetical protein
MYVIPIIVIVILAIIAVAWSPIFALIIFVPAFALFLIYIGTRPRADEKLESPTGTAGKYEDGTKKGAWGEPRG